MHINELQELMRRLYFARDLQRGPEKTFEWLVEEIAELGEALQGTDKSALESEFADAIAWLASLANVVDVDLEKAVSNKYHGICPKCKSLPCQCPL